MAGQRVRNLQAAKHWFASCHQPLGRLILYWDSILSTLDWVVIKRADSDESAQARDFLLQITPRKMILLAMLADIADEAQALLRSVDSESHDTSTFPEQLAAYTSHLHHLINEASRRNYKVGGGFCYFRQNIRTTSKVKALH